MATKRAAAKIPTPVKREGRICFGIAWFATEIDANTYDAHVKKIGRTYNGGYFHGMSCGRDTRFDYVDAEHGPLFAVTD